MAGTDIRDTALIEYCRVVKVCINSGKEKTSLALLQHALRDYPEDPFILSFHGVLEAKLEKKYQSGVEHCRKAINLLHEQGPGKQTSFPVCYLNLGRAYMAAGRRKDALVSFYSGLRYGKNKEIIKELEMAGMREAPPLPFLGRSNVINKYVGLMLHKFKNIPPKNGCPPPFMIRKRNSWFLEKLRSSH